MVIATHLVEYGLVAIGFRAWHEVEAHHTADRVSDALILPVFLWTRNRYPHLQANTER